MCVPTPHCLCFWGSSAVFDAMWNIKPRPGSPGAVANPRDAKEHRCGLRLARQPDPSVVLSSTQHRTLHQCSMLCGTSNRVLGRLVWLKIRAMHKSIAVVCAWPDNPIHRLSEVPHSIEPCTSGLACGQRSLLRAPASRPRPRKAEKSTTRPSLQRASATPR